MKHLFYFLLLGLMLNSTPWAAAQSNVSLSTGTLSAGLPIFTLQEGNLAVPISLGYDGSGVQVSEEASSVGLKWSMNAGSVIVRSIRGMPDEGEMIIEKIGTFRGYLHTGYPADTRFSMLRDFEPDVFTLIIGGQSVQFYLKKTLVNNQETIVPLFVNQNIDLKIEVAVDAPMTHNCNQLNVDNSLQGFSNYNKLSSFVVTTPDGVKYYFGKNVSEREYVFSTSSLVESKYLTSDNGNINLLSCPVSWYVSRIEVPKSGGLVYQTINFSYERRLQKIYGQGYEKGIEKINNNNCNYIKLASNDPNDESFAYKPEISSIESDNFRVRFNVANIPTPNNIATVIPDYDAISNPFGNFERKDISDLSLSSTVFVTCPQVGNPKNALASKPNPLLGFEKTKALKNIVLEDKNTGKRMGYYLHQDYFFSTSKSYSFVNGAWLESRSDNPIGKLKLKGVYPIVFKDNNTIELKNGTTFEYNDNTLPVSSSLARDHWGFYNGADNNDKLGYAYRAEGCTNTSGADPFPRIEFAQMGSMRRLKTPIGGIETYEYELHDCSNYSSGSSANKIGGLRVKKVIIESESDKYERTFSYIKTVGGVSQSSGYVPICPIYRVNDFLMPSIYGLLYSRFTNGQHVTYSFVKEQVTGIKNGQSLNAGYTEHEFYVPGVETVVCKWVNAPDGLPQLICTQIPAPPIGTSKRCLDVFDISDNNLFRDYANLSEAEVIRGYPLCVRNYNSNGVLQSENIFRYSVENFTSLGISAGLYLPQENIQIKTGGFFNSNVSSFVDKAGNINTLLSPLLLIPVKVTVAETFSMSTIGAVYPSLALASSIISYVGIFVALVNILTFSISDETIYNIPKYTTPIYKVQLSKTISRSYEPTGTNPIETTTAYFYGSQKHNQVTKTTTYRSDALGANMPILSEQNIKYSADYTVPANSTDPIAKGVLGLQQRSMLVPIETLVKRKNKVVGGQFLEFYADTDKLGLLKASHSLELSQALSTFVMSDVVAGNMTKHSLYKKQQEILAYNERGLAKTTKNTTENGTTNLTFGVNNYYPTEVAYTSGTKTIVKKSEYATPLFGASKITNADNSTVSYTYDDLGRIKEIKDQNGYLVKSYIYNEKAIAAPTDAITFELWGVTGVKIKDLANGNSVSLAQIPYLGPIYNKQVKIYITAPTGTDFVEISVLNNISSSGNRSFTDNDSTIWGDVLSFNLLTGSSSNASYTAEAKAYSKGLMIAKKKISFTVSP